MIYCAIIAFFLCFVFIFYISRHSWATHVKNLGVPDNLISEGMGHTSVKTTHIYIDFTKCNMLDLINKKLITGKSRKIKGI